MMVIDSTAADAIAKVLVNASGLNSRPLSPPRTKTGRKLTASADLFQAILEFPFRNGLRSDSAAPVRSLHPRVRG